MRHARNGALWIAVGLVAALGSGATPALAEYATTGATNTSGTSVENGLGKLGRGVANIITCPGEIVRTVDIVGHRDGFVAGSTVGLLQGAGRTILRAGAGVVEVLTFPIEKPKGYRPLIEPEYIFAHGAWQE